jgi:NAD(P)-dependent dehydrogenase (short-subunit alcohol dehydrogenase family)
VKTVLITGATGGLGSAVVRRFRNEGYRVLITVRNGHEHSFTGDPDVLSYPVDLTVEEEVETIFRKIASEHAAIRAALFLAGGFAMGSIETTDSTKLREMFSLNFEATYFLSRLVFQHMLTQPEGGRLVMVGSRPALDAADARNKLAYALSKSLVLKLAEIFNAEGEQKNVVTSVIIPSIIDTPTNRKAMPKANFSRWVTPEEIAEAMISLCSEKSKAWRQPVLKMYGSS